MYGRVKTYSSQKKYGFISGDDGKEYYFAEGEIRIPSKILSAGYGVQFETSRAYPNPKARNVRLI